MGILPPRVMAPCPEGAMCAGPGARGGRATAGHPWDGQVLQWLGGLGARRQSLCRRRSVEAAQGRDGVGIRPGHPPSGNGASASQSACLRRKAGISSSSMPLETRLSTLAAACVRFVRQTLGNGGRLHRRHHLRRRHHRGVQDGQVVGARAGPGPPGWAGPPAGH